ncbi:unnamed protein product [Brassicogethes aeneus]|uniref:Carboxylic ester hydrolase n=1 Tax=Brassicogethes aeneus TaxID=1431903 RepID=A0A9P0FDP6_BRAAE|nr:unnamed protein product [Brassicogethes aeneus]
MTDLIVTLEQGKIRGKRSTDYREGTYTSYLGIPYAKSPVGDLRFKAPQPPEPWEGIRDCSKEGNECPSLHMFFEYHVGNEEDCLNLNVHCKNLCPDRNTPVMVWIHGGAFMYGSNRSEMFGVDYFMTQDIVLVAINYRLGVFGFLSLDDPDANVPGNNGLKDMVMALKWVQKNIRQFGGDPDNVTIFGESAGSAAVHYLVVSEMARGLFHKAIMQSGCTLNDWSIGKTNGHIIAELLGYDEKDDCKILEKLRKESAKTIVASQFKFEDLMVAKTVRPFGPVVEKCSSEPAFLKKSPLEILKEGSFNKVPMIMGYNSEEGVFYEAIRKTKNAKLDNNLEKEIPHTMNLELGEAKSKSIAKKIRDFYFKGQDLKEENIANLYTFLTELFLNSDKDVSLFSKNLKRRFSIWIKT